MTTNAPVSNRTESTVVGGPGRKKLAILQVAIDLASDKGETPTAHVIFALRDWNGTGCKSSATGPTIRRRAAITSIDWSVYEQQGLVVIKGVMARGGVKFRCLYDPRTREGELFTESSEMY